MANGTRTKLMCLAALVLATLWVYWPATGFDFLNYDDTDYVTVNPAVQQGLTGAGLRWAFTTDHASNWHPLTWISHMLDCQVFGMKAGGHHLTNVLWHAANAGLLFLVLCQLTGATWRSVLVAALFAWHPLHVESVAWVSERKDVLSTFFWLLTMGAYSKYVQSPKSRVQGRIIWYALALVCFGLGLLAKPMLVTLPLVLLLLDFWPLGRFGFLKAGGGGESLARLVGEKVPFFALAAADCVMTFHAQRAANSVVTTAVLPWGARLANALVSCVLYLWKMLWPANLAVPYPYREWTFAQAAGAALLLAAVTAWVLWRMRKQPHLAVGWLWFLGTLAPVIGLVQVGLQGMADRYTYVPLTGIFIMVAWSIPPGWAVWPRPGLVFGTVTGAALVVLLMVTQMQLGYWRNSVTLFGHSAAVTSGSIIAEYNLAEALARQGDEDKAVEHYLKALGMKPNPVEAQYNSQLQAHFNLGLIWLKQKNWAEAEAQFRETVQMDAENVEALNLLGWLLATRPEPELQNAAEAVKLAERAVALSQGRVARYLATLDEVYAAAGRFPEAIAAAEKTRATAEAQKRPDLADAAAKRLELYRAGKPWREGG